MVRSEKAQIFAKNNRPRVVLSATISIDGKISGARGNTVTLSSVDDTARVHRLRACHDAILVGINTVLSDDPLLTVRHTKLPTKQHHNPVRVILDSCAQTPLDSKIVQSSDSIKTIIAVSKAASKQSISKLLQNSSVDVIVIGKHTVDIKRLLSHLATNFGIRTVMVEGGSTVNWSFIQKRLFDEIIVAISPHVLGGNQGSDVVSFVGGSGFTRLSDSPKLRLKYSKRLGDHIILSYVPY